MVTTSKNNGTVRFAVIRGRGMILAMCQNCFVCLNKLTQLISLKVALDLDWLFVNH